ncbi:hypothetical protein EUGRSUZ_E03929 [Eucalyptus grandis]|uniref:Uncharacterized protein n=2 Tax=Eucalyptus grandis TaxID=71139 RepID=A0ACC3L0L3_EUCGR|nr:hypothetical protein EUGRSUZ_E03929 [Eucalyptus grandis]
MNGTLTSTIVNECTKYKVESSLECHEIWTILHVLKDQCFFFFCSKKKKKTNVFVEQYSPVHSTKPSNRINS